MMCLNVNVNVPLCSKNKQFSVNIWEKAKQPSTAVYTLKHQCLDFLMSVFHFNKKNHIKKETIK